MKPFLFLAAGTPEALAELKKLDRAEADERYERAARQTTDILGDLLPVAVPAAGFALLLTVLALVVFRSRFAERWPRLRRFFGRPRKLRSRRELAPHPSSLSPKAGKIPLLIRKPPFVR